MTDTDVALVLPEPGALALLEHDGQAVRDYALKKTPVTSRRFSPL